MKDNERKDLQHQKEQEIIKLLSIANYPETFFAEMKNNDAIVINAPIEEYSMSMNFMTKFSSRSEMYSIKPGNILLNISNLIFAVPAATVAGAGIFEDSLVFKVVAFLLIWRELRDCVTIEITSDEANVMIALWRACDKRNHKIEVSQGLIATNQYLNSKHQDELNEYKYQTTLDRLIKIQAIEVYDGIIWLRERISKKYR